MVAPWSGWGAGLGVVVGDLTLGSEAGGRSRWSAQDPGDADREQATGEGAGQVGPPTGPVAGQELGAEGTGRVHRRPADRGRPQSGQRDIAPDGERRIGPHVAGPRGGA